MFQPGDLTFLQHTSALSADHFAMTDFEHAKLRMLEGTQVILLDERCDGHWNFISTETGEEWDAISEYHFIEPLRLRAAA